VTSVRIPAVAGSRARSKRLLVIADVRQKNMKKPETIQVDLGIQVADGENLLTGPVVNN